MSKRPTHRNGIRHNRSHRLRGMHAGLSGCGRRRRPPLWNGLFHGRIYASRRAAQPYSASARSSTRCSSPPSGRSALGALGWLFGRLADASQRGPSWLSARTKAVPAKAAATRAGCSGDFSLIAAYFIITEHRAHVVQFLPILLLLACPLLHFFHGHGGHGGHGKDHEEGSER